MGVVCIINHWCSSFSGGILENMFYIFVINAILPPLLDLIHPFRIFKMWRRKKILLQGTKANLTQQEANE